MLYEKYNSPSVEGCFYFDKNGSSGVSCVSYVSNQEWERREFKLSMLDFISGLYGTSSESHTVGSQIFSLLFPNLSFLHPNIF